MVFLVTTAKSGPGIRISTTANIRNSPYFDQVTPARYYPAWPTWTAAPTQRRRSGGTASAGATGSTNRERHLAGHQRLVWRLFDAAAISPGDRVLDVGCGCGETTIAAARRRGEPGDGSALGVDLSGPMLDVARGLADQAGLPNVGFVQADAQV